MQIKEIIATLENQDAKIFITNNLHVDVASLGLKYKSESRFNIAVCLQLMAIYKKAQYKIPFYTDNFLAITQRAYEQATSQRIAQYKCNFLRGDTLVDLTAGLGVDAMFLSKSFKKIIAVEQNEALHVIAKYNVQKVGINNVTRVLGDANTYLTTKVDWIYIDPDRRPNEKRSVKLENLEPNVLELIPQFEKYGNNAYIKLSPLFDVDEVWRVFKHVTKIVILAEQNEIKEVGVILTFNSSVGVKETSLVDVVSGFSYSVSRANETELVETKLKGLNYLLVPNALLTKSRLTESYLTIFEVERHDTFGYYFSEILYIDKGFRTFKILAKVSFNTKAIKEALSKNGLNKLNIIVKGLRDKQSYWHKKLKTSDGGNFYLFLLKGKTKQAYLCEFISS